MDHDMVSVGKYLYVFGGRTSVMSVDVVLSDSLSRFCTVTSTWTRLEATALHPSARILHSMTTLGNSIFLFGGVVETEGFSDELWEFSTVTLKWTSLNQSASVNPAPRGEHTLTAAGGHVYMFGGSILRQGAEPVV